MADIQSNIKVNIDTTAALASIKNLQRQISAFHTSMAKSGAAANAVTSQMQQSLINSINATGKFSAQMKTIRTTTESFTNSLEKNKFSLGEYFRYAGGASKSFGKLFKTEFDTINKVARENVKDLQTQYIKMGRDANGAMKSIAVRPLSLDMRNLATKTMIASEKQAILNQLLKQGSTNLLNFGKNTQWAGRQLMVGFTLPLIALGSAASKTFMDMETQAIKFKKVYGDLFTPKEETQKALEEIKNLGKEFTKYGIAVSSTIGLASEAAAAGFKGVDLQNQTIAATRLAVLGQVESQKALETTIALQNAFSMSSQDLAKNIDFLNAVENQTVLSLDDVATAIPKAGPVVQQLGGDVKDLAFFMTAMKEGGINASEGANALKSGLASMINPTGKATAMLESFGINVKKIVLDNKGDLKKTVVDFATALNELDPLNRAQAIEQMFGKFQFARLSTLFANVTKDGTQASRVLDLAGSSIQDLASLSEKELGMTADSAMNKFKASIENLKFSLAPVGEEFLKAITPIAQFASELLDKFNSLGSGTKKAIVVMTTIIAGIGPVFLMTFGLLANGIANIIKGFVTIKSVFNRAGQGAKTLGTEVEYMTLQQRNAAAVASSLDQVHKNLAQTFTAEASSVDRLTAAYTRAITAQNQFRPTTTPMVRGPVTKRATGKPAVVGGTGNKDSELALLTPGETVIPRDMSNKYGSLINGMIADSIPGYRVGKGTGTAVDIPGGFAAAHFGGSNYSTGTDLLKMVEGLNTAFANQIRQMVSEVEGGLGRVFTVFSNEVIATSTELNRAVGKTGTGKKASIALAKQDLIGNGEVRDIELQRQLDAAGVSIKDIKIVNKKVTDEIIKGFDKLGNITQATAEDLDKIINDAYNAVAKTDKKVQEAQTRMKKITTVTDPRNDSRIAVSQDTYTKSRKKGTYYKGMEQLAGKQNVPYQSNARFKITNNMADAIGLSSGSAADVYNQFAKEVKIKLAGLKGDITKFSAEFAIEAEKAGLKTGSAYKIGIDKSGIKDIYVESRKRNSPHPLAPKDGLDDANAYESAREKTTKKRRLSSRAQGSPSIGPIIPVGVQPLRIVPQLTAAEKANINSINKETSARVSSKNKIDTMNSTLMGSTFALTSLAGAGTMLDGKIGRLSGQIMKYSGLLFGLMQITQLLTQTKLVELVQTRANMAGLIVGNVATKKMTLTSGLFAGGIKKLLPNLINFAKIIGRFLGPIGMVVGGLLLVKSGFDAYNRYQEAARLKVEGLGDAALAAGEKITKTFEYFNATEKKFAFETYKNTGRDSSLLPTGQASEVQKLIDSDWFLKQYSGTIKAIVNSTKKETTLALQSFAMQLESKGLPTEQIDILIKSILQEAGKKDVFLDFKNLNISTEKGKKAFEDNISSVLDILNKKLKKGLDDSYKKSLTLAARSIAGSMGALQLKLTDGQITAEQYAASMKNINTQILAIKDSSQQNNLIDTIFQSMGKQALIASKGITGVSRKMLAMQAIMLGVNSSLIQGLASTDLLMQDIAKRGVEKAMADALITLKKFQDATNIKDYISTGDTGNTGKKALTAQEKLIKILEAKKKALEEEAAAYAAVNDEIDRRFQYQQRQMQLDSDITNAKISGNYIQAAILSQEKLLANSQFDTENKNLEMQSRIDAIEKRINELSNNSKLTAAENKLIGLNSSGNNTNKKQSTTPKKTATDTATKTVTVTDFGISTVDKTDKRSIPDFKPFLKTALRKNKTVVFNPKTGQWEEIRYNDPVPKGFISTRDWTAGKRTFASGGSVSGSGTGKSDSIPAMLSDGEYVVKASAVSALGVPMLDRINKFADGGQVDGAPHNMGMSNFGSRNVAFGKPDSNQSLLNRLLFGVKNVGGNVKTTKEEVPFGPGGLGKVILKTIANASLAAKGASVAAKGASVAAKGASVAAKGTSLAAKGTSVAAKVPQIGNVKTLLGKRKSIPNSVLDGMNFDGIALATGGLVPKYNIPRFKTGVNRVPQDMLAMIHKNEAVLPAKINPYNPNATNIADSGGTVYNINMPITSNNANPSGVADEVMRRLKVELNKNNKSNKVMV